MNPSEFELWLRQSATALRRPLVMGILNVTPDSFSDGGRFFSAEEAIRHAREMIEQGADLLDVGGESTRPGAQRVSADEQIARVVPVIQAVRQVSPVAISVDTTRAEVAEAAARAGASLINDVSAGREDPRILEVAAKRELPIVLMHMKGEPATMQQNPTYDDVVGEVGAFLAQRARAAEAAGVPRHRILLDPGIGFGKSQEHNLKLLKELKVLAELGYPVLLGTSRKRFLGTITGVSTPAERVHASVASAVWGILQGARIVRVHDVLPTVQALKTIEAVQSAC